MQQVRQVQTDEADEASEGVLCKAGVVGDFCLFVCFFKSPKEAGSDLRFRKQISFLYSTFATPVFLCLGADQ